MLCCISCFSIQKTVNTNLKKQVFMCNFMVCPSSWKSIDLFGPRFEFQQMKTKVSKAEKFLPFSVIFGVRIICSKNLGHAFQPSKAQNHWTFARGQNIWTAKFWKYVRYCSPQTPPFSSALQQLTQCMARKNCRNRTLEGGNKNLELLSICQILCRCPPCTWPLNCPFNGTSDEGNFPVSDCTVFFHSSCQRKFITVPCAEKQGLGRYFVMW